MVWQILCDYYIVTGKHFSHQPRLFRLIKLSALDLYHVDKLQLIKNIPIYMGACKDFYFGQSLVPAIIQLKNQINFDDNHAYIYKNVLLFLKKKKFDLGYVKQVMEYFNIIGEQYLFLKYFFKNNRHNFQTDEQKDFFSILEKLCNCESHFMIACLVQGYINKKYNKNFLLPAMKKILSLYQPYIFSNKKIKRHNLLAPQSFFEKSVIFATSASALKNSIHLLKEGMDYICYLYDPNKTDDLQDIYHIPKRNIKIDIKDLLQETCYEHSDFDIKIIHFIKNISNKIGSHTEYFLNKHNSYDFAIPNADIFSLAFQDSSYQMMRRIFGFIDILPDCENIYIFSDKVNMIKILVENIHINYSRKKIIFSHGLSKAKLIKGFQCKIVDLLGDTSSNFVNTKMNESVALKTDGYKKIHDYIHYDKDVISCPQKNGIMLSVIPQDGNYHKFGKYCATEILKRHIPLYFASSSNHNAMAKKLYTDVRDYDALLPADMHNFSSEYLEFFDVLKKALKTEVKDFVHLDQINTQKYLYDKIDYFVENRVLFCILYYNYMRIFLQKSDTKAVILSPGRSLWGWIITYAAQYHNILTVDVQTVVQSAHPRYYPTKCDIMTFMESEQYRLYQQTFPECTKKHSLIGSVIFDEVLDDLKEIQSLSDIKSFYKDYDNQKIVCVATQYSNGEHYLKIIQVLNDLTADLNFKLLVKIHPRETDFYISAFSNTIQNNPLAMFLDKTHSINHIIYDSDVIVTLFSNVGFLAALQQKDVIRPMLMPDNLPLDFVETGIAVDAQTPQELKKVLFDLLNQGEAKHNLVKTRKEYFDKNLFFQKSTTSLQNLFELDEIKNLFPSHLLDKNTKA